MNAFLADQINLHKAIVANPNDKWPRLIYADYWQEHGRDDVADLWRGTIPAIGTRDRIDSLTDDEHAQMAPWAKKWIKVGLSTEPADRPLFEAAATQCYLAAKLNPPRFVWCPSPLVAVATGVIYAHWSAGGAVEGAVGEAVEGAVREAVGEAVREAVEEAVGEAVEEAVGEAVREAVGEAVRINVSDLWWRYFGGQFWVGGYYWWGSPSFVTFFLDVLRLRLPPRLELAARAYAAACSSACWWWPHRDVVFVSERPHTLKVRKNRPPLVRWEGWGIGKPASKFSAEVDP